MFYLLEMGWDTDAIVYTLGLIGNHMRMKNVTTKKTQNKSINLVGQQMYDDLVMLTRADDDAK